MNLKNALLHIIALLFLISGPGGCTGMEDGSDSGNVPETGFPDDGHGTDDNGSPALPDGTSVTDKIASLTELVGEITSDQTCEVTTNVTSTELHYTTPEGSPMAMYIFKAKLSGGITVTLTTPDGAGTGNGLQGVTDQALAIDDSHTTIYGGTNADYFTTSGYPQGIFHHLGETVKSTFNESPARPRSFFYVTRTGKAGTAPASEYTEIASQDIIYEACGGGAILVSQGKAIENPSTTSEDLAPNPRTSIGVSEDGKTINLLVVDGRQPSYSNGLSLSELAEFMETLGCWSAINLDGGGSSTFYIRTDTSEESFSNPYRFKILNRPSDGSQRKVWNGLAIIRRTL